MSEPQNSNQKSVLICGGSGFIGTYLRRKLETKGYYVTVFSRKSIGDRLRWDPKVGFINPDSIRNADVIINLSGASLADKAWYRSRRQELFDSRILSTKLLYNTFMSLNYRPQLFINASATGFYGNHHQETITEGASPGSGFLSFLTWRWEQEARKVADLGVRTVILRLGLVLGRNGGALPKMVSLFPYYMGAYIGSGKQVYSWIHIEDLCGIIISAIEQEQWNGIYNVVSPNPVTNTQFSQAIARSLGKKVLLPNVPGLFLKAILGQRASLILEGAKISAQKVMDKGFRFSYPKVDQALQNLLSDKSSPPDHRDNLDSSSHKAVSLPIYPGKLDSSRHKASSRERLSIES